MSFPTLPRLLAARHAPRRRRSAGYSLVECLIATGLMTGVVVSISGLFIVGSRSVKSGRELTKATAIANTAMEQCIGWNYEKVYGFPGGIGTDQTKTWDTSLANPSWTGSADDVADMTSTATEWRARVRELQQGLLRYKVDGLARLPNGTDPGLTSFVGADFARVTVTVEWNEGRRRRQVSFEEIVL
jgi:hypothetical protein